MQTDADRLQAILASPSFRLAEDDLDFLESDSARAVRLALEFHRTDTYLRAAGIESTVVVFGSARVRPPEDSAATPADAVLLAGRHRGLEESVLRSRRA